MDGEVCNRSLFFASGDAQLDPLLVPALFYLLVGLSLFLLAERSACTSSLRCVLSQNPRYEDKPTKPDAGDDNSSSGPAAPSGGANSELDDLAARFMNLRK